MNRRRPASVGPERDHVVETIGAAETCWNIVEASSRVIDRVTSHRGGIAIEFDPYTDLRDGVGVLQLNSIPTPTFVMVFTLYVSPPPES